MIAGFESPLPFSVGKFDDWKNSHPGCKTQNDTTIFLNKDVIRYWNDDCAPYKDGDPTLFSNYALGFTFVIWVIVFLCIFKGVKSSSYVVWFTVPVPVLFIIVMIIKNSTLEGASKGVEMYL